MDIKLPIVPDGYRVVIHSIRPESAPADGVLWSIWPEPKTKLEAFLQRVRWYFDGGPGRQVTRVRGDLPIFEADMQEQADEYFGRLHARNLAWKIRSGR